MTERDISRQEKNLSPAQEYAAELIAEGFNDKEAAKMVKVSRQTINGWRNGNAAFKVAIDKARREIWRDSRERLRALCSKAIDTLDQALDSRQAVTAALGVIKAAIALERIPEPPPDKIEVIVTYKDEKPLKDEPKAITRGNE